MKSKFLAIFISLVLLTSLEHNITAAQLNKEDRIKSITLETVNPGSPQYVFKRLGEKIKLSFLIFSKEQRAKYYSVLLDKRYKEIVYLVTNNEIGTLEKTTSRYNTTAGEIMSKYPGVDPNLKEQIKNYVETLEILRDKFEANSAQWLLMQYTIDTTQRVNSIN